MFRLSSLFVVVLGVAGALGASQAPEFAQQYRQRLNGALDELARIVAQFDADAAAEGLDRSAALAAYDDGGSPFLDRRGASVRADIARLDRLTRHANALEATDPLWRPLLVAREADRPLLAGTWRQYEPAAPLHMAGALYAGAGFLVAAVLGLLLVRLGGRRRRGAYAR